MFGLYCQAILLGLALAAPLGPVNMLCFQRVITQGLAQGIGVALGASLGDTLFGLIGLMGLIKLSDFSSDAFIVIQCIGILFLLGMGIYLLKTASSSKVPQISGEKSGKDVFTGFVKGFLMTLSNPATLSGVIFGMGSLMTAETTLGQKVVLFFGVTTGSALWWVCLITLAIFIQRKISVERFMHLVNKATGLLVLGFSLFLGARLIWQQFFATPVQAL